MQSIVRELVAEFAERLPYLSSLPVQFQQDIPGVDGRVHGVGRECYAHNHGAEPRLQSTPPPEDMAACCVSLAKAMELHLAGIDLPIGAALAKLPISLEFNGEVTHGAGY